MDQFCVAESIIRPTDGSVNEYLFRMNEYFFLFAILCYTVEQEELQEKLMVESSCLYCIRTRYKDFSTKELMIADYILANPEGAVHPSIEELADLIGVSESTLVRFVKKIGYLGYQRFRIALAKETVSSAGRMFETPIDENDDDLEVVFNTAIATLSLTKRTIRRESITRAAQTIAHAAGLMIFGLGGSNIVALDAYHKFVRTGINCTIAQDFHMQLMMASQARDTWAALIVSHTGENYDTMALAEELKERGCTLIVLTSNPRSPLAREADILLDVSVASTSFFSEAFSARIAQAVVIDTLYVGIMKLLGEDGSTHLEAMRNTIAKRKT